MIKVGEFKDGLDMSAIREIKFLQELRHPNVIELIDVFSTQTNLNIVLEFLPADLEMIIKDRSVIFTPADIKSWMLMTLRGLHHCHRNFMLHRSAQQDLKPNNLLLSPSGHLKLADFGLARSMAGIRESMTSNVVTRWYRAPELLYGARHYTAAVDVWSVGIIFAELMLRTPYLPGKSDADQLDITFRALGTPNEKIWPGVTSLPGYVSTKIYPQPSRQELRNRFIAATEDALELMEELTVLNPAQRIDTTQALMSPYFTTAPRPTKPEMLPKKKEEDPNAVEEKYKAEIRDSMIQATRKARLNA
ncbi:hypothetical protein D0Z00_004309 [Geotrichum galactomycetum]|uniref:Uncharacterized protein n=1 Tax=Geotrichum galactomycetum TaxID=27317 RepID=A0ACB6UYU4_9ASCO|nr:hypothetical protein D0Z00_004309 [Geotrichum candidum]